MNLERLTRTFCVLALLAVSGVTSGDAQSLEIKSPTAPSTFAQQVLAIDRIRRNDDFGTILGDEALLTFEPFKSLSLDGSRNVDACLALLAAPAPTATQRRVAIRSMHLLAVADYSRFVNGLTDLYLVGRASQGELIAAALPGRGFSTVEIENFRDPGVRAALGRIKSIPTIWPVEKEYIAHILSGRNYLLNLLRP